MSTRSKATRLSGPRLLRSVWRRKLPILAVLAIAVPAIAIAILLGFGGGGADGPPRALIIDQLSLTQPNPAFAAEATTMLNDAGYEVDYVPGEEATIALYRGLPSYGYDFIFFRAHAGRLMEDGEFTEFTYLFTAEPYTPLKYVEEQFDGLLKVVAYSPEAYLDGEAFFGIPGAFVTDAMEGDFGGATVVLMGCDILRAEEMAEAFVGKGAGAVVGWDEAVSAAHTDAATLNLLRRILDGETSVQAATAATMEELGPDPYYDAVMVAYPPEE